MVATWDDNEEKSLDKEESHEMSHLALMAIGEEDDEVSDIHSYVNCLKHLLNCIMT